MTPEGSKRSLKARWICSSVAPSRTAWAIHFAAMVQALHARFSRTHWAMETGTLGQGASRSLTRELYSCRSRGVMALVSTPGSVTSFTSGTCAEPVGSGMLALESRQLDHPPTARTSPSRQASWRAIRKTGDV